MNPLQRRKLLQTSLAGMGVLGAVGASLGLSGATHTATRHETSGQQARAKQGREADDRQAITSRSRTPSPTPSVSSPQPSPPQASTSGS